MFSLSSRVCLIENRVKRHRLRIDRLSYLIQKRSTIEAKMFVSSQNLENAFIYADKAFAFALGRRLQSIQKVRSNPTSSSWLKLLRPSGTNCMKHLSITYCKHTITGRHFTQSSQFCLSDFSVCNNRNTIPHFAFPAIIVGRFDLLLGFLGGQFVGIWHYSALSLVYSQIFQ